MISGLVLLIDPDDPSTWMFRPAVVFLRFLPPQLQQHVTIITSITATANVFLISSPFSHAQMYSITVRSIVAVPDHSYPSVIIPHHCKKHLYSFSLRILDCKKNIPHSAGL